MHLPDGHFVFGGGAEKGQPTRYRTEQFVDVDADSTDQAVLAEHQRTDVFGWHGD